MPSTSPFVVRPASWRARVLALLDGAARQRHVTVLLAVAGLALTGLVWIAAAPRLLPAPAPAPVPSGAAARALPAVSPDRPALPAGGALLVHVAGRVRHPGLVHLPPGSRLADAVKAAGGTAPGANLDAVNLARKVADGEQVRIPARGEPVAADTGTGDPSSSGPLDLNTATEAQLEALPGIGAVTAGRIVAYRATHPFTSIEQLREIPGIGERRLAALQRLVTVG